MDHICPLANKLITTNPLFSLVKEERWRISHMCLFDIIASNRAHRSDWEINFQWAEATLSTPSFITLCFQWMSCSGTCVPAGGADDRPTHQQPGIPPYLTAPHQIKLAGNRDGIELHHIQIEPLCLSHLFLLLSQIAWHLMIFTFPPGTLQRSS